MRIAIISDIHSNLPAFEAVLADIRKQGIEMIVSLGDVVGYGADPKACLDLLNTHDLVSVRVLGNHESKLVQHAEEGLIARGDFVDHAWRALMYSKEELTPEDIESFRDWQKLAVFPEKGFTVAHGAVSRNHVGHYVFEDHFLVKQEADAASTDICFLGHTHLPYLYRHADRSFVKPLGSKIELEAGLKFIINPGSVGQPRDHDSRASYGILEIKNGRKFFSFRRVGYDINEAARRIMKAGLPEHLADRLRIGK